MKCDTCGRHYGNDNDGPGDCPECLRIIIANSVPEYEDEVETEPEPEADGEDYCPGCGFHQEDCECDPDEPQEGDLITEDHQQFFTVGESYAWPLKLHKPDVVVPDGEDWQPHVAAYMDREQFWPNVWVVSDHGNIEPLSLEID